jgi:putative ABC transport system substrate-binding protein
MHAIKLRGANVTGIANLAVELSPKQLQLLHDLMPNAALFGVLADPAFPTTQSVITDLQAAARILGVRLVVVNTRTDGDLETAFATFSQQHVGAVLVTNTNLFIRHAEQLLGLAARHALPAMFPFREFALAGGLVSYGSNNGYLYRQVGIYTGRILKGEKPADLPVQQITKIEMVINLKTAPHLPHRPAAISSGRDRTSDRLGTGGGA